jgi:hypothetical protein
LAIELVNARSTLRRQFVQQQTNLVQERGPLLIQRLLQGIQQPVDPAQIMKAADLVIQPNR